MALDKTPTAWIPGYSSNGTTISLPIASFPELTAAEAHTSTGDIRKILFAVIAKLHQDAAALAAADKPQRMAIARSTMEISGVPVRTYTIKFTLADAGMEVAAE